MTNAKDASATSLEARVEALERKMAGAEHLTPGQIAVINATEACRELLQKQLASLR